MYLAGDDRAQGRYVEYHEAGGARKTEGQAAGAKAWVVKPFQPVQMLAAVSKLILP